MAFRNPTDWMWAEACEMVEQAARMHRRFFLPGASSSPAVWEPPADVYEDERDILIVIAMPGVRPDRIEVRSDGTELVIRAERRLPFGDRRCAVRQLEIPHGVFEKRIALPFAPPDAVGTAWADGCLILTLRKAH